MPTTISATLRISRNVTLTDCILLDPGADNGGDPYSETRLPVSIVLPAGYSLRESGAYGHMIYYGSEPCDLILHRGERARGKHSLAAPGGPYAVVLDGHRIPMLHRG